ncbi:TIGR01777 family oxidoreductase [Streptomyces sp. NBC_00365]|uniref:TIGR01777 family oxidoreductase n=1 Tax=Streptomyces sp. NBC_00365 TaxID=2975726 RepID=UPI002257E31B|nr:TIGR01777 family oxidoreductase [Streptomyces sp. NBC_00365]MCX5097202.1 TIGR01777 family oxidoreductase [Streptomyces sp. NBC_00365]
MRVVVAGASGVIGTPLVSALREAGHEVLRLVRRPPVTPDERRWDPPSGMIDESALDGADAIINLCGAACAEQRWSPARKQELRDSRIVPTQVLAMAVAEHGIGTLLNGSGIGYYGDAGEQAVTESAPAGSGFLADMDADREAATAAAVSAGARVALLRTGVVMSPTGGMLGQLRPMVSAFLGGRFGNGRQITSWISLADEISAVLFVLEHDDILGPVNLTAPEPVTNAELVRAVGKTLHRPTPWVYSRSLLRLAAGELADEGSFVSQHVVPEVLSRHGFEFQHPQLMPALAAALVA